MGMEKKQALLIRSGKTGREWWETTVHRLVGNRLLLMLVYKLVQILGNRTIKVRGFFSRQ